MNTYDFPVTRNQAPFEKPDSDSLGFGNYFSDHMFVMDYDDSNGWHNGRIEPFAPISLNPAAAVLHYSQEIFEGLKAYRGQDGLIRLFRPYENAKRSNQSANRLCMPPIDEVLYVEAIKALVKVDSDWIPNKENTSLYIRPFMIATEAFLGVRPAKKYSFYIITSPVGSYYKEGLMPTKIYVEENYARSVVGGTGAVKTGGNYAASLRAQEKAHLEGFNQVLWLDGVYKSYVEEIGTSNAFFVADGAVFTSSLEGTILPGITRNTTLNLLASWDIPVVEKQFTIDEIAEVYKAERLSEVFATGTAAVISPVGQIRWGNYDMIINNNKVGPIAKKVYDTITGIQSGKIEDSLDWTVTLK